MSLMLKLKKNKNIISLILIFLFSFFLFFSNDSNESSYIENYLIELYSFVSYPHAWYKNIFLVKNENQILAQKLVALGLLNSKLENYKIENEKLRKMLDFKESYKYLSLISANIVNNNFSMFVRSSIINVGTVDDVVKNLTVIDENGNLVGKTISIGENNSKVQLISDNNFRVSVKIGKSIGQFKPTYNNKALIEGVLKTTTLNIDDIIYTSGISEIYPSDIPLAKVTSFSKNDSNMFQKVEAEILVDLENLYYVFIIN